MCWFTSSALREILRPFPVPKASSILLRIDGPKLGCSPPSLVCLILPLSTPGRHCVVPLFSSASLIFHFYLRTPRGGPGCHHSHVETNPLSLPLPLRWSSRDPHLPFCLEQATQRAWLSEQQYVTQGRMVIPGDKKQSE
jgi:hypothetical protein